MSHANNSQLRAIVDDLIELANDAWAANAPDAATLLIRGAEAVAGGSDDLVAVLADREALDLADREARVNAGVGGTR